MGLRVATCVYADQTQTKTEGPRNPRTHAPVFGEGWELEAFNDKQIQTFQTLRLFIYFEVHLFCTFLKQDNNHIMQM